MVLKKMFFYLKKITCFFCFASLPLVPPNAGLFSITHFLYGWQKIFMNKNIFSKHDLHVLLTCRSTSDKVQAKMYNKKNIYRRTVSLNLILA